VQSVGGVSRALTLISRFDSADRGPQPRGARSPFVSLLRAGWPSASPRRCPGGRGPVKLSAHPCVCAEAGLNVHVEKVHEDSLLANAPALQPVHYALVSAERLTGAPEVL